MDYFDSKVLESFMIPEDSIATEMSDSDKKDFKLIGGIIAAALIFGIPKKLKERKLEKEKKAKIEEEYKQKREKELAEYNSKKEAYLNSPEGKKAVKFVESRYHKKYNAIEEEDIINHITKSLKDIANKINNDKEYLNELATKYTKEYLEIYNRNYHKNAKTGDDITKDWMKKELKDGITQILSGPCEIKYAEYNDNEWMITELNQDVYDSIGYHINGEFINILKGMYYNEELVYLIRGFEQGYTPELIQVVF